MTPDAPATATPAGAAALGGRWVGRPLRRVEDARHLTGTASFVDDIRRPGLLSIAFHPRYAQNHRFYVDFTDLEHRTHVTEFTAVGGVAALATVSNIS